MKRKMRLPVALIIALMLTLSLAAVPVTAATAPKVKETDYDRHDKEVEFEFQGKVQWKNPTVKITKDGKNYVKKIKSKDSNDIEVKVKKLAYGETYSYKITGVKKKGTNGYKTVTGTFRAIDD